MDFKLAVEHEGSDGAPHSESSSSFRSLSILKMDLETQSKYANLVAEMLTFTTLTAEDPCNSNMHDSLKAELSVVQKRIKDMVHN